MKITGNMGFVTNSSSVVYHIPNNIMQDSRVQSFLKTFEVEDGFVGPELWHRGMCSTIAVTKEQKQEAQRQLSDTDYSGAPTIDVESDDTVIIFGDEHPCIAYQLLDLLDQVAKEIAPVPKGHYRSFPGQDYN